MRRQLTGAAMVLRLAGGEGAGSSGRGAAPKLSEALGSGQGSRKPVSCTVHGGCRWRRTGEETVTHQSEQGDHDTDEMQRGRVPFVVTHVQGGWNSMGWHLAHSRARTAGRACTVQAAEFACSCGARRRLNEAQWNCAPREGHARGKFVRTLVSGAELDREALGRWPSGAHGLASA
jgi:hypothetical protein